MHVSCGGFHLTSLESVMVEKPFFEHSQLIENLKKLGLEIKDDDLAILELLRIGYHRSGGYRYPFRKMLPKEQQDREMREFRSDLFMEGAKFEDSIRFADFDTKLKEIIFKGILDLEVRLRTAVAHQLAKHSTKAHIEMHHLDEEVCNEQLRKSEETKFEAWCETYRQAKENRKNDDFITHHILKHGTELPVWAAMEVLSFGSLITLIQLLQDKDRNDIANLFGVRQGTKFTAWLLALRDLRNDCAHGARVFNNTVKRKIAIPPSSYYRQYLEHIDTRSLESSTDSSKIYRSVAVLAHMLRCHKASTKWHLSFKTQMRKLPEIVLSDASNPVITPERNMGFPENWEQLDLWRE